MANYIIATTKNPNYEYFINNIFFHKVLSKIITC